MREDWKRGLTEQEVAELKRLEEKPDDEIDFSDIPEQPAEIWRNAKVGLFSRPGEVHTLRMLNQADVSALSDEDIDTADIPVMTDDEWQDTLSRGISRPVKRHPAS